MAQNIRGALQALKSKNKFAFYGGAIAAVQGLLLVILVITGGSGVGSFAAKADCKQVPSLSLNRSSITGVDFDDRLVLTATLVNRNSVTCSPRDFVIEGALGGITPANIQMDPVQLSGVQSQNPPINTSIYIDVEDVPANTGPYPFIIKAYSTSNPNKAVERTVTLTMAAGTGTATGLWVESPQGGAQVSTKQDLPYTLGYVGHLANIQSMSVIINNQSISIQRFARGCTTSGAFVFCSFQLPKSNIRVGSNVISASAVVDGPFGGSRVNAPDVSFTGVENIGIEEQGGGVGGGSGGGTGGGGGGASTVTLTPRWPNQSSFAVGQNISFSASASSSAGISSMVLSIGTYNKTCSRATYCTSNAVPAGYFSPGTTVPLQVTATDNNGNSSTQSSSVTIE
jgi:hypothetical protein